MTPPGGARSDCACEQGGTGPASAIPGPPLRRLAPLACVPLCTRHRRPLTASTSPTRAPGGGGWEPEAKVRHGCVCGVCSRTRASVLGCDRSRRRRGRRRRRATRRTPPAPSPCRAPHAILPCPCPCPTLSCPAPAPDAQRPRETAPRCCGPCLAHGRRLTAGCAGFRLACGLLAVSCPPRTRGSCRDQREPP